MPAGACGVASANVGYLLESYVRQRSSGYVTSNDSGVILERHPDTVRGPDVALYEDAQSFAELHPKYGENRPVLAVEVLSPSDRTGRTMDKIADYLANDVKVVWLIDPETKTVFVFRPNQQQRRLTEADDLDGGDELPGFRAAVKDVFFVPTKPGAERG